MLNVSNLSVRLGARKILNDISFSAEAGHVIVLLGMNGSGKTTLFRTISGNIRKYSGKIEIHDRDLREYSPEQLAKVLFLLPQTLPQPKITVEELIAMGLPSYDHSLKLYPEDQRKRDIVIRDTGLSGLKNSLICHLSGGERQRAFFALALAHDTELILMDEPTSALDTAYRKQTYDFIREMKSEGKTVLLTLHDLNEAVDLADSILVLDKGSVCFTGSPDEFSISNIPESIFGMRKQIKEVFSAD